MESLVSDLVVWREIQDLTTRNIAWKTSFSGWNLWRLQNDVWHNDICIQVLNNPDCQLYLKSSSPESYYDEP